MNETTRKALTGAVSGLFGAFLVDLHAWSKSGGNFSWALASKRWLAGAISGATAGLGIGGF